MHEYYHYYYCYDYYYYYYYPLQSASLQQAAEERDAVSRGRCFERSALGADAKAVLLSL